MYKIYISILFLILIFSGCAYKKQADIKKDNVVNMNLNNTIVSLAEQLLKSSHDTNKIEKKIVVTSFVELSQLDKTTQFGRVLSESMINELYIRGFNIIDFRGQDAIVVNPEGEFHLTRDIAKLRPRINNSYVLVATYANFTDKSVAVNARIIDFDTGDVISTARAILEYEDCRVYALCKKMKKEDMITNDIRIVSDMKK